MGSPDLSQPQSQSILSSCAPSNTAWAETTSDADVAQARHEDFLDVPDADSDAAFSPLALQTSQPLLSSRPDLSSTASSDFDDPHFSSDTKVKKAPVKKPCKRGSSQVPVACDISLLPGHKSTRPEKPSLPTEKNRLS